MPSDTEHTTFERTSWPRPAARELGLSLLLLLACVLGAEALVRTDYVYARLPLPRPYYSYDVTRRLEYLARLREQGPIDVLFVGSSVVRSNVDPTVFDAVAGKHAGRDVLSFNAGMSNMFPPAVKLYVEHLWLEAAAPKFVLHGVREAELASGPREAKSLRHGRIESLWLEDTAWSLLQANVLERLRLAQYRGVLRTTVTRWRDGSEWHPRREKGELATDERGFRAEKGKLEVKRKHKHKRLWKYRRAPEPKRYKHSLRVLEQMRAACARAGATYVLVHMPEHPDRFATDAGPAVWQDYQQRIRDWAKQKKVPFIDITDGDLHAFGKDEYYSDFHHMHGKGAKRFSKRLAERFAAHFAKGERR